MKDATGGIEPPYQVLQTYAYPLGHMAVSINAQGNTTKISMDY